MKADGQESRKWRYCKGLGPPLLLFGLLVSVLIYALQYRLRGDVQYDDTIIREWIEESRAFRYSLPELIRQYFQERTRGEEPVRTQHLLECIQEHLMTLGEITRTYQSQLPLFPLIYRLTLELKPTQQLLVWDSQLPKRSGQVEERQFVLFDSGANQAKLSIQFQLHAYAQRQESIAAQENRVRSWLSLLALMAAVLAVLWVLAFMQTERRRDAEKFKAQQDLELQEKQTLEERIRREQAEREREESDRHLLEVKIKSQETESQALMLKSQLYANIGIMAGSYAHNIKNLMVRPNDLIQRCLKQVPSGHALSPLLHEMQQTLHLVTERTQQILNTVRRDPTRAELKPLDLCPLLREVYHSWYSMAEQKWKIEMQLDLPESALWIEGDASHLVQTFENLLFNARDAIFELRNQLREQARHPAVQDPDAQKQALIAAAAWRGKIEIHAQIQSSRVKVSIRDNGIGMNEEVKQKCTETHFSTKRHHAGYEGLNTGMGLGLSFVLAVLEKHQGELQIQSHPHQGSQFDLFFPRAAEPHVA